MSGRALRIDEIATPPSVNGLFLNVPGRGRVRAPKYDAWYAQARWTVMSKIGLRRLAGPVSLTISIGEKKVRGDLDNRCKALIDLLVSCNVIDDDDKSVVRRILLEWAPRHTTTVLIEPIDASAPSATLKEGEWS